jgi:drug/metabolite transporter (DMT)-like permease
MTAATRPLAAPRAAVPAGPKPSRLKLLAAFGALYIVWGSTYLAIRHAVTTLPPFLMTGVRFLVSGAVLFAWARSHGAERPRPIHWRSTAIVGFLLLACGNGAVVWSEQWVPSGLVALLVSTMPLWMVMFEALRPGGSRPAPRAVAGIVLGFAGLMLLIGPTGVPSAGEVDLLRAGVLLAGSILWAAGSIYSRAATLPASSLLTTGMQMLTGGVACVIVGLVMGEAGRFDPERVSRASVLAWLYLVTFGSLVGFTAFAWLLRVSTPARVSTYSYVNPVVAVFLGWALLNEPVTPRMLAAAAVIVAAVVLITTSRK